MQAVQFPVPIEIVSAVSQRTHSVVQLPKEIEQVLGKHLGAGSKKGLRADSQALLQELRSRSRSTSRGGVNDLRPVQASQEDRRLEYLQQQKVHPDHPLILLLSLSKPLSVPDIVIFPCQTGLNPG